MSNLEGILLWYCLLLGIATGLRSMTTPAAVSWAARLGLMNLQGTYLSFFGFAYTPYILTLLAIGELIGDKLPMTPSRKKFVPFFGRVAIGCTVGAALGVTAHEWFAGMIAGAIGAVVGTLGGAVARGRLAQAFGKDLPAALIEDAVAIGLSAFVVTRF